MNMCDGNRHDTIVYEGRTCPLCELIDIRDNLDARIGELEVELDSANAEIDEHVCEAIEE